VDIKNSRVYFAHDPELDSTPFVYLPSMNSNRPIFISTAYQTPCHSRIVSNQAVDRPVSVKSKDEEDLFGLGAFSDVFISDQDLVIR
jgi:hypothetical protein